jgi:hypothetical protein
MNYTNDHSFYNTDKFNNLSNVKQMVCDNLPQITLTR